MSKRTAEYDSDEEVRALKAGDRPHGAADGNGKDDDQEFEDEFEDEFESEDEIFEAGVDGRPDEEREAEERENGLFCPNSASASGTAAGNMTGTRTGTGTAIASASASATGHTMILCLARLLTLPLP